MCRSTPGPSPHLVVEGKIRRFVQGFCSRSRFVSGCPCCDLVGRRRYETEISARSRGQPSTAATEDLAHPTEKCISPCVSSCREEEQVFLKRENLQGFE